MGQAISALEWGGQQAISREKAGQRQEDQPQLRAARFLCAADLSSGQLKPHRGQQSVGDRQQYHQERSQLQRVPGRIADFDFSNVKPDGWRETAFHVTRPIATPRIMPDVSAFLLSAFPHPQNG
jgi:hypothetical protein